MTTQDITPIQHLGDYCFKRDDLFVPFDFSPANGSKLRQCMLLCEKNADRAKNGLYTGTSIHSPQAVITASVAKSMGVPCTIVYGGTTAESLARNKYARICETLGAKIVIGSKLGYTSVLTNKAKEIADFNNGFNIQYGFDLRNNADVFIGSVANQVQNIPNKIDYLVITIGSAITAIGVLLGIEKYNKQVGRVIGVGCAPNRENKIKDYAEIVKQNTGYNIPIHLLRYYDCFSKMRGYKYENTMNESYMGITFHPRYEAKTFNFMKKYVPKSARTLMWVTGHEM